MTLPVAALGAAYLGGTRLGSLAEAGLVTEARAGSLAVLSTAMSWEPAPLVPHDLLTRDLLTDLLGGPGTGAGPGRA